MMPTNVPNEPYGHQSGAPVPIAARTTNAMAIAALVCSLVFAPLGIVFGYIARSQIKRTGEGGRGLATAGLVLGYVLTIVPTLIAIVAVAIILSTPHDQHNHLPATIIDPPEAFFPPPTKSTTP